MIRTVTAVERADVVVVVIDATEGVTEQDAKIAGIAHERGKGVIIAVNNGMQLKRMIKPSTNTPTVSVKCWHTCLMRSLYLFLQNQSETSKTF